MIINIDEAWRPKTDDLQWHLLRRIAAQNDSKRAGGKSVAYARDLSPPVLEATRGQIFALEGEYPPTAIEPLCETLDSIEQDTENALGSLRRDGGAGIGVWP